MVLYGDTFPFFCCWRSFSAFPSVFSASLMASFFVCSVFNGVLFLASSFLRFYFARRLFYVLVLLCARISSNSGALCLLNLRRNMRQLAASYLVFVLSSTWTPSLHRWSHFYAGGLVASSPWYGESPRHASVQTASSWFRLSRVLRTLYPLSFSLLSRLYHWWVPAVTASPLRSFSRLNTEH